MGVSTGKNDPKGMPAFFFSDAMRLDYSSATRANVEKQYASVIPRYWYIDAIVKCQRCEKEFCFTAAEQRVWYEEYGFWIDSFPKRCLTCRHALAEIKALQQEYDRDIARALGTQDIKLKRRMIELIKRLVDMGQDLPPRIHEKRRILSTQIDRDAGAD